MNQPDRGRKIGFTSGLKDEPSCVVAYRPMTAVEVAQLKCRVRSEKAWETLRWANYGPDGDSPREETTLADLDTDHLEAILITQPQISPEYRAAILELIRLRWADEELNELAKELEQNV